jgi:hypothetical protein
MIGVSYTVLVLSITRIFYRVRKPIAHRWSNRIPSARRAVYLILGPLILCMHDDATHNLEDVCYVQLHLLKLGQPEANV